MKLRIITADINHIYVYDGEALKDCSNCAYNLLELITDKTYINMLVSKHILDNVTADDIRQHITNPEPEYKPIYNISTYGNRTADIELYKDLTVKHILKDILGNKFFIFAIDIRDMLLVQHKATTISADTVSELNRLLIAAAEIVNITGVYSYMLDLNLWLHLKDTSFKCSKELIKEMDKHLDYVYSNQFSYNKYLSWFSLANTRAIRPKVIVSKSVIGRIFYSNPNIAILPASLRKELFKGLTSYDGVAAAYYSFALVHENKDMLNSYSMLNGRVFPNAAEKTKVYTQLFSCSYPGYNYEDADSYYINPVTKRYIECKDKVKYYSYSTHNFYIDYFNLLAMMLLLDNISVKAIIADELIVEEETTSDKDKVKAKKQILDEAIRSTYGNITNLLVRRKQL